ncbi:MAG TPA: 30S ribosomal protein S4 [Firmicutes bacterium]|jgi:small subunit ribosomal protein S4|nr:30S ribosomal protein S4 [Bacillota bacterium]
MARYTDASCRLCRREGTKLYLKGDRCYSEKCAFTRKGYPPGAHGRGRRQKISEYGLQLREKQKTRRIYGVLEKQFRRYFVEADRRKGVTGETLLQILESRLDNIVFRMGLARSRAEARQLIRHGHFAVNNQKVNIPSYLTKQGDEISVREGSKNQPFFKELAEWGATQGTAAWLDVDREKLAGKVIRLPLREELDIPISEHLIVELYSR